MPSEISVKISDEKNATLLLTTGNIQSRLYSGEKKMTIIESGIHMTANRAHARYTPPRIQYVMSEKRKRGMIGVKLIIVI